MMLLRKNPRKSKFWQREEEDALPPPPSPASFLGQKDSGYPNCQNSEQFVGNSLNGLKLEVNGLYVTFLRLNYT